jgi:hypothetical protein
LLALDINRTYSERYISRRWGFVMDGLAQGTQRDVNGRFIPGQSGNPAGKRPGTRNRATVLREALGDGEDIATARIVIDKALAGDAAAARFIVDRLTPRPRGRAVALDLPEGTAAGDIVAAYDATLRAMASGEITPDEALSVSRVLDGKVRALKAGMREGQSQLHQEKPSPLGRGQGEGACRTLAGAGNAAARRPHPDPLPKGEGMAWGEREGESPAFRLHFPGDGGERLAEPPPEVRGMSARQFDSDSMRSGRP